MPGGDWSALTEAEEKALTERYAEEIAREFDPQSQVRAMEKEGLDLAILFPTSAMCVTAFTTMDPRLAAAACRAHNDWLYDYIEAADPQRMFGAAAVSPHEVESAVGEARRAVTQLDMKAAKRGAKAASEGDGTAARELLQRARTICPADFTENLAAKFELPRLRQLL